MRKLSEKQAIKFVKKKLLDEFGSIRAAANALGITDTSLSESLQEVSRYKIHNLVLKHLGMSEEKKIVRNYYIN